MLANLVKQGPRLAQLRNSGADIKGQSRTGKEGNLACWGAPLVLCKGDTEKHAVTNKDSTRRFNQAKFVRYLRAVTSRLFRRHRRHPKHTLVT